MGNKVRETTNLKGELTFNCPGCKCAHHVFVEGIRNNLHYESSPVWGWNKSFDKPTFTPSILVSWNEGINQVKNVCHSFVKDGFIQYLGDCTHEYANKTIELPNYDES